MTTNQAVHKDAETRMQGALDTLGRIRTNLGADDIVFEGLTVQGSAEAGLVWAGDEGLSGRLDRVVLADNDVGLDGWGTVTLDVGECRLHGNGRPDDGAVAGAAADCLDERPAFGDLDEPAGPDGWFDP